ncbi:MAG TPA: cytochrome c family protein [Thermohalobaculum sp.]|nr:cytochrome c family protein [Thermohalobaculum sp.]
MSIRTMALATVLAAGAVATTAPAQEAGDAEAGEKVFRKCMACHTVEEGQNRVGPSLHGVVGRDVASVEDFSYSDAMLAWGEGKTWDAELLDTYLEDPRGVVEGTTMIFAGLKDEEDRRDVIAYLDATDE